MKKKLVILSIGMLPLVATHAQQQDTTLVRTVVVENEYNPTVMDASKINVLPKVEEPTVPKTHIDYANSIRPLSAWNYQAMQPIVKDWKADAAYRGSKGTQPHIHMCPFSPNSPPVQAAT